MVQRDWMVSSTFSRDGAMRKNDVFVGGSSRTLRRAFWAGIELV
jgi:hypothetical protein